MFRQLTILNFDNFPDADISDRLSKFENISLGALSNENFGWEKFDDDKWLYEHDNLCVMQISRLFRRIPKSVIKANMDEIIQSYQTPPSSYEKKQIRQIVIDKLTQTMPEEKQTIFCVFDFNNNKIWISVNTVSYIEKILRLLQNTFPGISMKSLWNKNDVLKAMTKSWKSSIWPMDAAILAQVDLIKSSNQNQKIKFSGLDGLDVVEDCILYGYVLHGVRLQNSSGLTCYLSSSGSMNSLSIPKNDDEGQNDLPFDYLLLLELREWILALETWVNESK